MGVRIGSLTEAVSWSGVALSRMVRVNSATTGSMSLTLHGAGMLLRSYTLAVVSGMQSACEGTAWLSETSVRVQAVQGQRGSRRVSVTAGQKAGCLSEALSYAMGGASVVHVGNQAGSTGSMLVTLYGAMMGLLDTTASARSGMSSCEASSWVSDTTVRCKAAQKAQGSLRESLTFGLVSGSLTEALSTGVATLSRVHASNSVAGTGSSSVTVTGSMHGLSGYTLRGLGGVSSCEATSWVSDSCVRCLVSRAGLSSRRLSMTAGGHLGSVTEGMSVSGWPLSAIGRANTGGTGSVSLTMRGEGMGLAAYTGAVGILWSGCESSRWESDTSMRCSSTAGVRSSRVAMVSVGGRAVSLSQAVSFMAGMVM